MWKHWDSEIFREDFVFIIDEEKIAPAGDQSTNPTFIYSWKSGTVTYKPNCIIPEVRHFYLFNLEAVV